MRIHRFLRRTLHGRSCRFHVQPHQIAILPDLAAGCSMADMANLAKVERCWRELNEVLNADAVVTPVTYINSAADLKAFCGAHGGIVCTSSNARSISEWSFAQREKFCFSRINTWVAGRATRWAFQWTKWSSTGRTLKWADSRTDYQRRNAALERPLLHSGSQMFQPSTSAFHLLI